MVLFSRLFRRNSDDSTSCDRCAHCGQATPPLGPPPGYESATSSSSSAATSPTPSGPVTPSGENSMGFWVEFDKPGLVPQTQTLGLLGDADRNVETTLVINGRGLMPPSRDHPIRDTDGNVICIMRDELKRGGRQRFMLDAEGVPLYTIHTNSLSANRRIVAVRQGKDLIIVKAKAMYNLSIRPDWDITIFDANGDPVPLKMRCRDPLRTDLELLNARGERVAHFEKAKGGIPGESMPYHMTVAPGVDLIFAATLGLFHDMLRTTKPVVGAGTIY